VAVDRYAQLQGRSGRPGTHAPTGTELDSYNGVFYVSVVGFLFLRTRVLGAPLPWHQNFEEVNLRFYVRRNDRRGVVFLKEIVPKRAIAAVARALYNENYVAMPMSHRMEENRVEYGWRHVDGWNYLRVLTAGKPVLAAQGSLEEFITEHYWGYTRQRDGGCLEYRVEHIPWRLWQSSGSELICNPATLYGHKFAAILSKPPRSAFVAEGSPVAVYRGVRI
jgi:uncharacterized protein YqjF (DUF2071 family)